MTFHEYMKMAHRSLLQICTVYGVLPHIPHWQWLSINLFLVSKLVSFVLNINYLRCSLLDASLCLNFKKHVHSHMHIT